jgi:hypothetical protein
MANPPEIKSSSEHREAKTLATLGEITVVATRMKTIEDVFDSPRRIEETRSHCRSISTKNALQISTVANRLSTRIAEFRGLVSRSSFERYQ